MKAKKAPSIREAPMVRIPAALLRELEDEVAHSLAGANLSRTQAVSLALREWLDGRKGRSSKTK